MPLAATVKVAVYPAMTICAAGCALIDVGVIEAIASKTDAALVTGMAVALSMTTLYSAPSPPSPAAMAIY